MNYKNSNKLYFLIIKNLKQKKKFVKYNIVLGTYYYVFQNNKKDRELKNKNINSQSTHI